MVRQLHDGMNARVHDNSEYSKPFPVTNGVKQGCVLAPTLFSMVLSPMLSHAFQDRDSGVGFHFRTDGSLFNLRRLEQRYRRIQPATSFTQMTALSLLVLSRICKEAWTCLRKPLMTLASRSQQRKLKFCISPPPNAPYIEPNITVYGQRLAVAETFIYLGSTLSCAVNIEEHVAYEIPKASAAFGRLKGLCLGAVRTQVKVYRAVVLPTFLYACETWTVYSRDGQTA